jgi:hypothetical protein
MTSRRVTFLAIAAVALMAPASAYAAGPHVAAGLPVAGILGSVFGGIGHALLGAFSWTIGLASKFVLTTIAALVKMLIPHSWVHQGLQIMQWIVAVPDYAGKVTSPGGGTAYGFAGINALRDTFMWLGIAIAPLTLVYATSRAMIGEGDPVGIPVLRMLAVSVVIVSYPYWWAQAIALTDQITNAILTIPDVSSGLYKLMDYAVGGVALGGWQLIDLGLMGAIAIELLGLIFLKVVLILLGALLYATGPVTIGLVPTRAGSALARAWTSAVLTLLGIGVAWATLFAVGALLIGDAGTAGPLVAGNNAFGSLAGGLLLAVAGLASLWLCLKAAKEAGSLLRIQLSGLLVIAGSHSSSGASGSSGASRAPTSGSSLRDYGSRLARSAGAANGELARAGAGGAALAGTARAAAHVGRRGLIGTAASSVRAGAGAMTSPATAALGHTRAGAVASRMARAGTASWIATAPAPQPTPLHRQSGSNPGAKATAAGRRNGRHSPSTTPQPPDAKSRGAASRSAKQSGGTDQPARKPGPIAAGTDRSSTTRRANPASRTNRTRPAAPASPPPSGSARGDQRPTPNAAPAPPTPARRSSPPPPPAAPPSARKPAIGSRAPAEKPEQAPGKRPGRRWRNPKRGER